MSIKKCVLAAILALGSLASTAIFADGSNDNDHDDNGKKPLTVAVFGDWPYNQNLLNNAPLLINSINADASVKWVLHVGDIHSGSMPCTSAGIVPPIATAVPDWNQNIYYLFQQFNAPVVYTPGDNEWSDCHKAKEKSSGDPLKELANVRKLFFAKPGFTLGVNDKQVLTQAKNFDHAYPADAKFVENVIWFDSSVAFVTVNMPGSNNDTVQWTGNFSNYAAQAQEVAERTDADIRWLQTAFAKAEQQHARAVVIGLQADMWDPAALAVGADGLNAYTSFVQKLAELSLQFKRPVLLINGDSHIYGADHPLADPYSATRAIHHTVTVPNLTRVTVQGSTNGPAEWLRLTIDPRSADVFSWVNVPYCKDPLGSCQ